MVRTYLGNERSVVLVESDRPPKHRNAAAGERNSWLPTPACHIRCLKTVLTFSVSSTRLDGTQRATLQHWSFQATFRGNSLHERGRL
jgi:hypothetical protein